MRALVGVAVVATLCGCRITDTFECAISDECRRGDTMGLCESTGYCSFADPACDSQQRYDDTAGDGLANTCTTLSVSGTYINRYLVNGSDLRPLIVDQMLDASVLAVEAELDDGTSVPVTYRPDGTFTFPRTLPEQRYELRFTVEGALSYAQYGGANITVGRTYPGRPDRIAPRLPTTLTFAYPQANSGVPYVVTTGTWTATQRQLATNDFSLNWNNVNELAPGSLALLDSDKHDRLYFMEYTQIDGYAEPATFAEHSVKQTDGGTVTLSTGLTTLTATDANCVAVETSWASDFFRLFSAVGGTSSQMSWTIAAAPARQHAELPAFNLAFDGGTNLTDVTTQVRFANPLPITTLIATQTTGAEVSVALPGSSSLTLLNLLRTTVVLPDNLATCAAMPTRFSNDAAIATNITLAGTALDANDKLIVANPASRLPLTWSLGNGLAHLYLVTVSQLVLGGAQGMATRVNQIVSIVSDAPEVRLPADLFEAGATYIVSVTVNAGRPNTASGDYLTIEYPQRSSLVWSRTFQVVAP